jgi:integrase
MRRTFGRWAVMGHLTGTPIPLYTVSRWLGHHNTRTTLIYLDIEEEESARFIAPD